MARTPGAEDAHGLDELLAGTREGVGDLRRRGVRDLAMDDAVGFHLAELRGQDFFADAGEKIAKLREALRAEAQMPDGEDFPFAADDIDGALHGTAVVIFHGAFGLTRMCVLPAGARWLYHRSEVKKNRPYG
jgi:hypothetical protein